jgi:hypothetical protein
VAADAAGANNHGAEPEGGSQRCEPLLFLV